jgi:hypothetical protein
MADREKRLSQSPTGTGGLVRGPIQTGRMKINLVSGEPGALHLCDTEFLHFRSALCCFDPDQGNQLLLRWRTCSHTLAVNHGLAHAACEDGVILTLTYLYHVTLEQTQTIRQQCVEL